MKSYTDLSADGIKKEIVKNIFHEVQYNSKNLSEEIVGWMLEQRRSNFNKVINEFVESIQLHEAKMKSDTSGIFFRAEISDEIHSCIWNSSRILCKLIRSNSNDSLSFRNDIEFKSIYNDSFISKAEVYKFDQIFRYSEDPRMWKFQNKHEHIEEAIYYYRNSNVMSLFLERIFIKNYLWREFKKIHETNGISEFMGGIYHHIAVSITKNQFTYILAKSCFQFIAFVITWLLIPLLGAYLVSMNLNSNKSDFTVLILISALYCLIIINKIVHLPSRIIRLYQVRKYGDRMHKAIGDISKYMEYLFSDNFNISQFKSFLYRFDADFGPCDPELYNLVEEYSRSKSGRNGKGGATSGAVLSNDESKT